MLSIYHPRLHQIKSTTPPYKLAWTSNLFSELELFAHLSREVSLRANTSHLLMKPSKGKMSLEVTKSA